MVKISYNWLNEFIPIDNISYRDLAEILLSIGFEVSDMIEISNKQIEKVVTGEILSIQPHYNANELSICVVTDGVNSYNIVCGAKNITIGSRVALALPGSTLPDGTRISVTEIRGVVSHGMLCSAKELGLSENHTGVLIIPNEIPLGKSIADVLGLSDAIFDIEVPSNRPDCLGQIGLAREIAAKLSLPVRLPPQAEIDMSKCALFHVENLAPTLCSRYIATTVENVENSLSPLWIISRLHNCGIRPINLLVDITNYVMCETGHPLHVFDLDKLDSKKIIIRKAKDNEIMPALDGKNYLLDTEALVITDDFHVQALAGIIGSETSAVTLQTKNILLECAIFAPANIRLTRKKLNIFTESSYRFERGMSWEMCSYASSRALYLILTLCHGQITSQTDLQVGTYSPTKIILRPEQVKRILGKDIPTEEIVNILTKYEMKVSTNEKLFVEIPSYRLDLKDEIDLIEEIARAKGYNFFTADNVTFSITPQVDDPIWVLYRKIENFLSSQGFYEVQNYSFISEEMISKFGIKRLPIKVTNPLSKDWEMLRPSLLPSLFSNLIYNKQNYIDDIHLFELGKIFFFENDIPKEVDCLGIITTGKTMPLHWQKKAQYVDFYYITGIVKKVLEEINLPNCTFEPSTNENYLHPNIAVKIISNENVIGYVGAINPELTTEEVYFAEVLLSFAKPIEQKKYVPFTRLPRIQRDISLVVDKSISYNQIVHEIKSLMKDILEEITLFEIYSSKKIPKDKKVFNFRLYFAHTEHTLTNEEVNRKVEQMISYLKNKLNISLRIK